MPAMSAIARTRRLAALVTGASLLVLVGASCAAGRGAGTGGSGQPATPPAPATRAPSLDPAPAQQAPVGRDATVAKGTGYRFTLPAGWQRAVTAVRREGPTDSTVDLSVAGRPSGGGVAASVTVLLTPARGVSLEDYAAARRDLLARQPGHRLLGQYRHLRVAGVPAVTLDVAYSVTGASLRARQLSCLRGDRAYDIVLTADEGSFPTDVVTFEQLLATWSWS
jgi:hypothetical protein